MTPIANKLQAAAAAYHNGQTLLMTDAEFDAGVDALRAADPNHPFLNQVGAPITTGDEVTLPIPLPSLNKIKPDGSLEKWLAKHPATTYHCSAKLDGCSALWIPGLAKLYTRGDGLKGRDISAFANSIQGLVPSSGKISNLAVRGELIMRSNSSAIPAGKLARNIVAGALNRNDIDSALFAEIRFVAYELVSPANMNPEAAFTLLKSLGFETARAAKVGLIDMNPERLSALFTAAESKSEYQLDGIVVAPNTARSASWKPEVRSSGCVNPADRVAWKTRVTAQTATTTVKSVEWNISAHGVLIPRVLFDPVTLAGANIGAATGLHGRWIFDNGVGPGAKIEVRRAGDVIPQIIAVHSPSPTGPAMPPGFEWASEIHIKPAEGSADLETACIQLTRALGELGAENVGPGMVARLYAAGFKTLGSMYTATAAEFAARVEGCKGKMAERIYEGLRAKQATWTELNLMVASCTMPRGVGHTKLTPLLAIQADPACWQTASFAKPPAGLSQKTVEDIVAAIPAYLQWRTANGLRPVVTPAAAAAVAAAPAGGGGGGYTVVFTGVRDKALEAQLLAAGHTVTDSVTKKTTHMVHPDGIGTPMTTKVIKAQQLGCAVLSITEFRALVK